MKEIQVGYFFQRLSNKKTHFPLNGQLELTYRCNLNCIHCYCKGIEEKNVTPYTLYLAPYTIENQTPNTKHQKPNILRQAQDTSAKDTERSRTAEYRELSTEEWKEILDEIHREGCIWLAFTGGDPLVRDDFLEIYSYAKAKGLIITIFTNGLLLTEKIIDYLQKSPPESIEITLNGITKTTYESIAQVKGCFKRVISIIKELADKNLPLILKSNYLRQNKNEIGRIKAFVDELLGKGNKRWRFKYDPMIYPRLNGDTTPCNYRLSFEELLEVKHSDPEIWEEYKRGLCNKFPDLGRDREFVYRCNAWLNQFFINPYGRLKFCQFSDKFSVDLRKQTFKGGFYSVFPRLLKGKFKTDSKCKDCSLRPICYHCPARAYLETGDEEAPVSYYCELAEKTAKQMKKGKSKFMEINRKL